MHVIPTFTLLRHMALAAFLSLYLTPAHANPEQMHGSPLAPQSLDDTDTESARHLPPTINEKFCRVPNGYDLPELNQVERSDWINVKNDVNPGAVGDGLTDDTPAIQAALNKIGARPGTPKVVYLPPGAYRITETLTLKQRNGGMIIGHGISTRLIWDGEPGGRMFWSNGAARQSYIGIVWDGAGKAGVGIDHDSKTLYETRVLHEHMEFRNFITAGIRVGHDQKIASAEMLYNNLIFNNNSNGVLLQSWNDYNNIFDGCHFANNDFGVNAKKGNVTIRNSRFDASKVSDLFLGTHSHSVRRIVSSGSHTFISTTRGPIAGGLIRVQDSYVTNWKNKSGAIVTSLRGPIVVFDSSFLNPPSVKPPIRLGNPKYMSQLAVLANIYSPELTSIVDPGVSSEVHHQLEAPITGSSLDDTQTFIYKGMPPPEQIFDVKIDCGAKGNGMSDDYSSIQSCFDAARNFSGRSALVYFPSGSYRVTDTLTVPTGSQYQVEGTGWHSQIIMHGKSSDPTLHIINPDGARVRHLALGRSHEGISLLQSGSKAGSIHYHNLFGYHDDHAKKNIMVFESLPNGSQVLAGHLDGRLTIRNSSAANILLGFLLSRQLIVEGTSPQTGRLGILSRVSAIEDYPLIIRDNQSLIMTDWYNEQSKHLALIQGNNRITGKVIIDHTKAESTHNTSVKIDSYNGLIASIGGIFGGARDKSPRYFKIQNGEKTHLILAANTFWHEQPVIEAQGKEPHLIANTVNRKRFGPFSTVRTQENLHTSSLLDGTLNAFRQLGALDLAANYCHSPLNN